MANDMQTISILSLVIKNVNVVLHASGCYLLLCMMRAKSPKPQLLFIFCLSLVQICRNVLPIPLILSAVFGSRELVRIRPYIRLNILITCECLYYLFMMYLTIDRLLAVRLTITYRFYCTKSRALTVIFLSVVVCSALGLLVSLLYRFGHLVDTSLAPSSYCFHIVFDCLFIGLALVTYGVLFYWYWHSPTRNASDKYRNIRVFRNNNFIVPVLIITSFLFLVITTDLIDLLSYFDMITKPLLWQETRDMLLSLSDFTDGVIYIVLHKGIREMCVRKIGACAKCTKRPVIGESRSHTGQSVAIKDIVTITTSITSRLSTTV